MADPLFLLDGYSVIYRSYFAFIRNPLRNPKGENSSAIFGFVRQLISLFNEHQPHAFIVAMDSKTPTFRHERYAEYKANRDKTPDDLHAQIPVIEELLDRLGVPRLRVDGYEADDVMATLAERCRASGRECHLITGDKDLLQLVDGPVDVLRPGKNGIERMDRDAVHADWQVWPEQILDYLSMVGDSSDNVPGVKGIGAKTAATLLGQFGTLDEIYANLSSISSASQRTKLEDGRDSAYLSRELITLASDAPVPDDVDSWAVSSLQIAEAAPILLEQGMRTLIREAGLNPDEFSPETSVREDAAARPAEAAPGPLPTGGAISPLTPPADRAAAVLSADERASFAGEGSYECVSTLDELDRWVAAARDHRVVAFDCETDSLDTLVAEPVGFSMAVEPGRACYIPLRGPEGVVLDADEVRSRLAPLFVDDSISIVGQNFKYDLKVLERWGVPVTRLVFDTMIAAWLVDTTAGSYGMDKLAELYLDYQTVHYDAVAGDDGFAGVPLEAATRYAAEDADITFRLYVVLDRLLDRRGVRELFETLEMPLVPVLARIEQRGIGLDVKALEAYSVELGEQIESLQKEIFTEVGYEFNVASTQQLQRVLFEERGLQPIKKTKTGYSTDSGVLQELAREDRVPQLVLRYRMLSKLRSTYVDALPRMVNETTGRIHTSLNQTGTATGRISSNDPNLQNIPIRDDEGRRIRDAFVPKAGWTFVSADYSQVELVILAHLSGDDALREAFIAGEDVHKRTAHLIFGVAPDDVDSEQRRIAKTINFGVMYGMSAFRLSNELGISRSDADSFIKAYFGTYNGIRRFIDETVAQAESNGEIRTLLGRPRPLPDIRNRNKTVKAGAERVAVNTPIQGTGADIVKRAMLAIDERLRREQLAARMVLQVHDELILECPDDEVDAVSALLMEEMSTAVELAVPLRVSVEHGRRWGAMHG